MRSRTGGDRTRDPNIKSVVLYQLSYSPGSIGGYYTKMSDALQNDFLFHFPVKGAYSSRASVRDISTISG